MHQACSIQFIVAKRLYHLSSPTFTVHLKAICSIKDTLTQPKSNQHPFFCSTSNYENLKHSIHRTISCDFGLCENFYCKYVYWFLFNSDTNHSSHMFPQPLAYATVQSLLAKGPLEYSMWRPSSVPTTRVFNFTPELKLVVSLPDWNLARALLSVMEPLGANVAWHVRA